LVEALLPLKTMAGQAVEVANSPYGKGGVGLSATSACSTFRAAFGASELTPSEVIVYTLVM
jgi:hypothetical protein